MLGQRFPGRESDDACAKDRTREATISESGGQGFQYRPDIDGLRAVAIVIAICFHAGLIFRGGFIAVDMFFVISGFLITSLVTREIDSGRFRFITFWKRRVHRLFPALMVATSATMLLGAIFLLPEEFAELGRCLASQSLMATNFFFYSVSGYFAGASQEKPFLHYWSLAVEEQFYLMYPVLLWMRLRRALLVLGLASFALTTQWVQHDATAAFYLLPTRTWELLLGAAIALYPVEISARWRPLASWVGLLGILAASLLFRDDKLVWPGWATLVPCGLTALMIIAHRPMDTVGARWLSHPRLVHLGVISYSWYLWHWPMMAYWNYWKVERTPVYVRVSWLVASYLLARWSFRYVETPLRHPRPHWSAHRVVGTALALQFATLLIGLGIQWSKGLPARFSPQVRAVAERGEAPWMHYEVSLEEARSGRFHELGQGPVRLWLWGDSQAMSLIPELERLAQEQRCKVVVATHTGAPPLLNYPAPSTCTLKDDLGPWNQAVVDHIARQRPPTVLLVARWNYQLKAQWEDSLAQTVSAITGSGSRCALMLETPVYGFDPRKALARALLWGGNPELLGLLPEDYALQVEPIREKASKVKDLQVLDPTSIFLGNQPRTRLIEAGQSLYRDDTHLNPRGAARLRPLLDPLVQP